MKVLGIETSGDIGGIAICEEKRCIIAKEFKGMQHGKALVPAIQSALKHLGLAPADIDVIAVDVGPGSYTGLRIGITCAKTLSYVIQKPVIDVPVFDIIAENHITSALPICPVIDARRKHVYACVYEFKEHQKRRLTEFLVIEPSNLLQILPRPVVVFGNGISSYKDVFQQEEIIIGKEEYAIPKAENVALLGEKMYESGHRCEQEKLLPLYLRKAEAIERKEDKN